MDYGQNELISNLRWKIEIEKGMFTTALRTQRSIAITESHTGFSGATEIILFYGESLVCRGGD